MAWKGKTPLVTVVLGGAPRRDRGQCGTDLQDVNHVTQQPLLVVGGAVQVVAQCHQFKLVSFSGNARTGVSNQKVPIPVVQKAEWPVPVPPVPPILVIILNIYKYFAVFLLAHPSLTNSERTSRRSSTSHAAELFSSEKRKRSSSSLP